MKNRNRSNIFKKVFMAALVSLLVGMNAFVASAADVVLNPGYISGTISVTGHTIIAVQISAAWYDSSSDVTYTGSATIYDSGSYTLTVHVPEGATPTYTVNAAITPAYGSLLKPLPQSVVVTAFNTSTADFHIDPGYVNASVTATSGTLRDISLFASGNNGSSQFSASASPMTVPVIPDASAIRVNGYVFFTGGGSANLTDQYVTVGAGETASVSWTVSPPPQAEKGTIAGTMTFNGKAAGRHDIAAYGPGFNSISLTGNGNYLLPNLAAGYYHMYADSYFDNNASHLSYPDSSFSPTKYPITVSGGATAACDIFAEAAFISGTLTLTGVKSLSQMNSAFLKAPGVSQIDSQGHQISGGFAETSPNRQTGAYGLVVTPGQWRPYLLEISYSGPHSSGGLSFYDDQTYYNPVTVAAGQTVTKDMAYGIGAVTVKYTVAGGGKLSFPSLGAQCSKYDQNNQLQYHYSNGAQGDQINVTEDSVTFFGMEGTCSVSASAMVNGSTTTFGQLTVNVVPGSSQEIDIGGPSLTVTAPLPDAVTSNAAIIVTGAATDDGAVDNVTVNGVAAQLIPPGPAASVGFMSEPIQLNYGPNTITVVATDTSGNTSSDTRTIYRDDGPPTLIWTPVDGATTTDTAITVSGMANDETGIESVTVNGQSVTLQPTGNGNKMSFNTGISLGMGVNFIVVVATDSSNRTTAQTHRVTVREIPADTTPPVITAAASPNVNGWTAMDVTVSWSVLDPESGIASSAGCETATVTAQGITTLTCSATNGVGLLSSRTFTVKIDKSAPDILPTVTPNATGWNTEDVTVNWSVTDPDSGIASSFGCGTTIVNTDTTGTVLTCTATNGAGLSNSTSVTVRLDKTAPVISGLPAPGTCTLWPPNHKLVQVATVSANGGLSGLVSFSVTGSSSEPEKGLGDGDTAPDIVIEGGIIQLRAERSGNGAGRIYTLTATAIDSAGNSTTLTTTCTVPHDRRK